MFLFHVEFIPILESKLCEKIFKCSKFLMQSVALECWQVSIFQESIDFDKILKGIKLKEVIV